MSLKFTVHPDTGFVTAVGTYQQRSADPFSGYESIKTCTVEIPVGDNESAAALVAELRNAAVESFSIKNRNAKRDRERDEAEFERLRRKLGKS